MLGTACAFRLDAPIILRAHFEQLAKLPAENHSLFVSMQIARATEKDIMSLKVCDSRCLLMFINYYFYWCIGASITLSPSGMVSVCPGGQVLLTCERMSGSFLYWTVSVPHLPTRENIVPRQGVVRTALQFNGLHPSTFTVTRTSGSPLTSQMMVNDVTTEINGSTIYCSEDGDENGAPMITITVINEGIIIHGVYCDQN